MKPTLSQRAERLFIGKAAFPHPARAASGGQTVNKSRGPVLTTCAVLFAILAISNFSKPFHLDPNAGFVFFGMKTHGLANAILGPVFGLILIVYVIGIWRMRRWVLPIAGAYAAYVIVNLLLFSIRNAGSRNQPGASMLVYIAIAVGVSGGGAILLYRRRAELV
jgi:hypothetical protein